MFKSLQSTLSNSSLKAVSSTSLCFRRTLATKSLFISNLPWTFRKTDIHNLVAPHGPVFDISYPKGEDGHYRGFAFVKLREENIEGAIAKLNGFPYENRMLKVSENKLPEKPRGASKDRVKNKVSKFNNFKQVPHTKSRLNQTSDTKVQDATNASVDGIKEDGVAESKADLESTDYESFESTNQNEAPENITKN